MQSCRREIVFPFFLHCCRETEDGFWKYVFEDLAYSRAPYGAYFTKGFFCCSFKGKEFSYKVDPNTPTNVLFREVKLLLQDKLNIQSREDKLNQRREFDASADDVRLCECDEWTTIKRKEVRNLLLDKYALTKGEERGWSKLETKRFLSSLLLAFQLKALQGEDVHVEKGVVKNIAGVEKIESMDISSWNYSWRAKVEQPGPKRLVPN